eukprot:scaffold282219_cov33-Tisochrysis_lutea.AAC.3
MNGMRAGYVHANDDLVDGVGSIHRFIVPSGAARRRITHLRLDQLPDGGIARLRAWGVVFRDFERELAHEAVGRINLLSEEMGGRAVGATDSHYETAHSYRTTHPAPVMAAIGDPRNLLKSGRGERMDSGWETARQPGRPHVIPIDPTTVISLPGGTHQVPHVLHCWMRSLPPTMLRDAPGFVDGSKFKNKGSEHCVLRLAAQASDIDEVCAHHNETAMKASFIKRSLLSPCLLSENLRLCNSRHGPVTGLCIPFYGRRSMITLALSHPST